MLESYRLISPKSDRCFQGQDTRQMLPLYPSGTRLYRVFSRTYRIIPVSETIRIMARVPAHHCDEGIHDQSADQKDLEDG